MINWVYFPKSDKPTNLVREIVKIFNDNFDKIDSTRHKLKSDEVLSNVSKGLEKIGFQVEKGKKKKEKIPVPVLFGQNGVVEKYFEADAFFEKEGFVLEVEAGRAFLNNQFLKDLFQACMMHNVEYLGIAVRMIYLDKNKDYEKVVQYFDTLYASNRLQLPLKGLLVIGY